MEIKKIITFIIFLLLITSSYLYMANNYSETGIEIRLASPVEYEVLKDSIMAGTLKYDSINYEKDFNNNKLIMTTGMDMQFKNINMKFGEFITSKDRDLIVFGDKTSDRYFQTDNPIGRDITLMGRKYKVKGIIKNSDEIYISYEKDLLKENWDSTVVRIEPIGNEGIQEYNRRKQLAFFGINQMGIKILDRVYYGDIIYFYKNIALFIIILNLGLLIRLIYKDLKESLKRIWADYKGQSREITILRYKIKNIKVLLKETLKLLAILILGYFAYKVFKQIRFNKDYFPDNIFSLESYYLLIKNYFERWVTRLEIGLTKVLMDFVKVNLIIVSVIFILLIKDKVFTKVGGGDLGRNTVKEVEKSIS